MDDEMLAVASQQTLSLFITEGGCGLLLGFGDLHECHWLNKLYNTFVGTGRDGSLQQLSSLPLLLRCIYTCTNETTTCIVKYAPLVRGERQRVTTSVSSRNNRDKLSYAKRRSVKARVSASETAREMCADENEDLVENIVFT
ncbi:hypothetical protein EMCRGX_G023350 [Ephydatia muelleri]